MPDDETIDRKIYFFRLEVFPNEDGSVPAFSIKDVLASIEKLKFIPNSTGMDSRYSEAGRNVIGAWPSMPGTQRRIELGRIRRRDLPSVEHAGNKSPLPIGKKDGLSESTHIMFFPKNIVGAEFNFHGPRATAFSDYCQDKCPKVPHFKLKPLLHRNAAAQLNELKDIRVATISVHRSHLQLLEAAGASIPDSLEQTAHQFDAESIDIVLRAPQGEALHIDSFLMLRS